MVDFEKSFVVIDKPPGKTSHKVAEIVRILLKQQKSGHLGTLDPDATGVLIVTLNKATKVFSFLNQDKEYIGIMHMHRDVGKEELLEAFRKFTGEIIQIPPKRSAVKRAPRKRKIYSLDLLEISGREVLFHVSCESGTYIRKLCSDIGEYLGSGAHLYELRRIKQGPISIDDAVTLYQLEEASREFFLNNNPAPIEKIVKPVDILIPFKKIYINQEYIKNLYSGQQIKKAWIKSSEDFEKNQTVAIFCDGLVGFASSLVSYSDLCAIDGNTQIAKTLRLL